jgi:predicted transcriptional regulator of viral defense system
MKTRDLDTALEAFREKGGTLRTRDMVALGVHTDALYTLRDTGRIVELGRGLYRLAEAGEVDHPDLAEVAARAPNAAVCLISALSYHNITTQIPSSVHLAVSRGSYHGIKLSMPVTVYRFSPKTFNQGLETQHIGRMPLKIYSAARTVVIASSSGTNSAWTSRSRPCASHDNENTCKTVSCYTTPGCCASKNP